MTVALIHVTCHEAAKEKADKLNESINPESLFVYGPECCHEIRRSGNQHCPKEVVKV